MLPLWVHVVEYEVHVVRKPTTPLLYKITKMSVLH